MAAPRVSMRALTEEALARHLGAREFAAELYHRFKPLGVWRDWDRVARTNLMEASTRLVFARDRHLWTEDTLIYRTVAAIPCDTCLLLYVAPDGLPRRFTVREVEEADTLGWNRGPRRLWHVRIGVCHPNCLCTGYGLWHPALERVLQFRAANLRARHERLSKRYHGAIVSGSRS
jgi:hypothetical protein